MAFRATGHIDSGDGIHRIRRFFWHNRGWQRRFMSVKAFLTTMVLASAAALAQQTPPSKPAALAVETVPAKPAAPEPTLKAGSAVSLEALTAAKWIQGEGPKEFEAGKVYMFECWATWCGPCIAAIPHVNDLHKKYHDKGLRVYGMNVWEDGEEKVAKFVNGKGDGMSYPIAYTGKDSAFEKEWLKPAGVRGIPHAFIVRDGKLVLTSHPSQLTDSVIEALLAGGVGAVKAAEEINAAKDSREKTGNLIMAFRQAMSKNDADTMAAKIAELEKIDSSNSYLPSMKFDLLIARKEWEAASKSIKEMPEGPARQMTLAMAANRVGMQADGEFPAEFVTALTETYAAQVEKNGERASPMEYVTLSTLQWKGGGKDKAQASAKQALEIAAAAKTGRSIPKEPFERFAKSLEDGTLPSMREFSGWVREAMKNAQPKPAEKP